MQCDKVIRELAVPTDDRDPASLAEHLAECPSCAVMGRPRRTVRSSLGSDPTGGTHG